MANKKTSLGKDFFSILDENVIESRGGASTALKITSVEPRSDQPRKDFDHESLEQLAESISSYGVLQPIIVRENPNFNGHYEIIAGERRWRAAKMAGLNEIPAIIIDSDDFNTTQLSLVENLQRVDLNPVEEAFAYHAMAERYGLTQDQIARQVNKNRSTVANALRLLDLPDQVLEQLKNGNISAGHARALLGLKDPDTAIMLTQKIIDKGLSVRDVERTVQSINDSKEEEKGESADSNSQRRVYMKDLEHKASSLLERKVRIVNTAKKKTIELTYNDDADLEFILSKLCGEEFFKSGKN